MRQHNASEKQRELPLETGDEVLSGSLEEDAPVTEKLSGSLFVLNQPDCRGT
jgi:hypothetical protein